MDVFTISPASPKPLWMLIIICVILAVIFVALAYTAYSSRNSRIEVENDRIRLVGDFWGREIPFNQLNISSAGILDLGGNSEYSPKRRTFGTGLPGYASGWFRLRSGEKALVYLRDLRITTEVHRETKIRTVASFHSAKDTLAQFLRIEIARFTKIHLVRATHHRPSRVVLRSRAGFRGAYSHELTLFAEVVTSALPLSALLAAPNRIRKTILR